MTPEEGSRSSPPGPDPALDVTGVAQNLYAEFLLHHSDVGPRELDALCAAHPEEAGELRALHDVQQLLALAVPPATPASAPSVPGFECLRLLGSGGMGEVWEAIEVALDRRVALKLQPLQRGESPRDVERWRREILAAGRFRHPNAVALHSAGESGGRRFIVQELVAGGRALRDEIEETRRSGQVPPDHDRRTAARFARLADALQTAHDAGVVHRDVKPQNILIEPDGTPKLADFGLAMLSGATALSRTGEFVGTYLYASPEQILSGDSPVGPASDVFSLGVTLYECLTLERPFAGDDVRSIVQRILRDDPPSPRSHRARIPLELALICLTALEKRAERRYASAAALRDDLERFLDNRPIRARPPSPLRRAQKWTTRHPTAAATTGLSSTAFLVILALFLQSRRHAHDLAVANELLTTTNQELELARDRARSEADLSREVEAFLSSLFGAADPDLFGTGNLDLRQLVDEGTRRLASGEITDVRVRARLTGQLGILQSRFGRWDVARDLLQESVDRWSELGEEGLADEVGVRAALGGVLADLGHYEEAEALLTPLVERWHRDRDLDPSYALAILVHLASSLTWSGRLEEAETLLREARELLPAVAPLSNSARTDALQVHAIDVAFASVAFLSGRLDRCATLLGPACDALEPFLPAGNTIALEAFNLRGMLLNGQRRLTEAAALFERLLPIAEDVLGPAHARAINVRTNLATAWIGLGRMDEAEAILLENTRLAGEGLGEESKEAVSIRINLGSVLTAQGKLLEAEATLERAIDLSVEHRGPDHLHAAMARSALAICYFRQGRPAEAAELQDLVLQWLPEDFAERPQMEQALAIYRAAAGTTPR